MRKIFLLLGLIGQAVFAQAIVAESFVVKSIRIEGTQKISKDTVLQDLPIDIGATLDDDKSDEAIRALYKSGFFKNVVFEQNGNTLVIKIVERPAISSFELTGIKNKDDILKLIKKENVAEGRVYDPVALSKVEAEIEKHYLSRGRYGVKVESTVSEEPDNKVKIKIEVYEGSIAKIKNIKLVGNTVFSDKTLLKEFHHSMTNWLSWYSKDDRYAKEKLAADLEILQFYYMDRGYLNFQVDSTQVSVTPDKKHVYITINVSEGEQFNFGNVSLGGDIIISRDILWPLVTDKIETGKIFSRKDLLTVKKILEDRLGEDGYSNAEARINTDTDEQNKTIKVEFFIIPEKRVTVRRVVFEGNPLTEDQVLRRGNAQMESTWISTKNVREGKEYILREGFASQVDVETTRVLNKDDQVDLTYKIEEQRTAQVSAGIAYSGAERFTFNLGADFKNFFGSGKNLNFTFDNSKVSTVYNFGYFNPYYTSDGIGMGYNLHYQKTNISKVSNVFEYSNNSHGADIYWAFPMSQYDKITFAVGYDNTSLDVSSGNTPQEANDFLKKEGYRYKEYNATLGWRRNTFDFLIFPTSGVGQRLSFKTTLPASKLKYYRLEYDAGWYRPIINDYILNLSTELGYASGYSSSTFPFFRHYFAGGADSIRGFEERSIGPKDSNGRPFGGNVLISAKAAVIFPTPFAGEAKNIRSSLFLDAGQVYDTNNKHLVLSDGSKKSRNPTGLKYAIGVSVTWNTPLHIPMVFSLAKPLNTKDGDKKRTFAFTFGTQFF